MSFGQKIKLSIIINQFWINHNKSTHMDSQSWFGVNSYGLINVLTSSKHKYNLIYSKKIKQTISWGEKKLVESLGSNLGRLKTLVSAQLKPFENVVFSRFRSKLSRLTLDFLWEVMRRVEFLYISRLVIWWKDKIVYDDAGATKQISKYFKVVRASF